MRLRFRSRNLVLLGHHRHICVLEAGPLGKASAIKSELGCYTRAPVPLSCCWDILAKEPLDNETSSAAPTP